MCREKEVRNSLLCSNNYQQFLKTKWEKWKGRGRKIGSKLYKLRVLNSIEKFRCIFDEKKLLNEYLLLSFPRRVFHRVCLYPGHF